MTTPFVSVIIPVYNDSERLHKCLESLEHQTYPQAYYEVIVVDNNSTEDLKSIVSQFKQAQYEFESAPGSYAARNKGINHAKGEIFAFIDSDCLPQDYWIAEGVNSLKTNSADLVGGQVTFTFSPAKGPAELYDSVTNMQIKENIETRKISKTANLFTYKYVFDKIGLFPAHLKSGGDVLWTKKATDANFQLVYAPAAEVFHPARNFWELMQKQYRVGKGQLKILQAEGQSTPAVVTGALKGLLKPPSMKKIQELTERKGLGLETTNLFSIWLVSWMCQASKGLGRLSKLAAESSLLNR
ncbi:glycosyltransferase [Leptothoe sp. PORK10 BA2]|uniref:glycosyltransferase n=1 Tax=Leptothoe sp. PORK10 BA2 TaxID=3110254 RepID=UPI002B200E07|nr:glycosyltransferase [Leptothoe sp. PORK10 BA2]MEA5466107.1 glycosyltransferase [Leptothoe sp. PORK10 BA2]